MFDKLLLKTVCTMDINTFKKLAATDGSAVSIIEAGKKWAVHIDRGSKILGVAHLDTVKPYNQTTLYGWGEGILDNKNIVMGNGLDDRLGVYILLYVLPELDITCDVLLTIDEEKGYSTGGLVKKMKKQYNWMFEFDRAGTDIVTYRYKTKPWLDALNTVFPEIGIGSFSDISSMGCLGISGVNIGTGYYNAHTRCCYAELDHTEAMVNRFKIFYDNFKDTKFPHTIKDSRAYRPVDDYEFLYSDYTANQRSLFRNFPDTDIELQECPVCGHIMGEAGICFWCSTHDNSYNENKIHRKMTESSGL